MHLDDLAHRDFEQIEILRDADAGLLAFVVIHDTRLGPAFGGIRRWTYDAPSAALADALRLAESMTLKCAISGVPGGGGKAVIVQTPGLDRTAAYRAIGRCVARLGGRYYTGPDVGTSAEDLQVVATETEHVAVPDSRLGDLSEPTAIGVFAGIRATVERLGFDDLRGVHVAVQGLGEVGARLASRLAEAGARLSIADVRAGRAAEVAAELGAAVVSPAEILTLACDVLAPCALGGIVDARTLGAIAARAIAGSANNVLASPELGERLFARGVLYAPDFLIGSGALVHGACFHLEGAPPPVERVLAIGDRVGEVLDEALRTGVPPERIAERIARDRIAAAGGAR